MGSNYLKYTIIVSLLFIVTIFLVVLYANGLGPGQRAERKQEEEIAEAVVCDKYTLCKDFKKYTGQTVDQMRAMYKGEAATRVRTELVLEAIRKAENLEPSQADIDDVTARYAEQSGREVEEFKASLNDRQKEYLKENAAIRKVVDLVVDKAEVEVKDESERISAADAAKAVEEVAEAAEKTEE